MNEQLIGDLFAEATRRMTGSSSREFSQKFAELIVRECMNVVSKATASPNGYQALMKHFGVEE
jgi:hypothetical protein